MSFKRFIIATLVGVVAGVVCVLLASSGGELTRKAMAGIFASRVLIGFVIGISGLKINWALHGIGMGLIVSIPGAFNAMMAPNPDYSKWMMFFMWLIAGAVYGFVAELVTSVIFKAKIT